MLLAKKENLLELILQKEIEDEILMDELQVDIVKQSIIITLFAFGNL